MQRVTVSRTFDASPELVGDAIRDLEPFMQAAGFDEVTVEGETIRIENQVGIMTIALTLALVDDPDAVLAYEQREGIFEEMYTSYAVQSHSTGCEVTARTTFALDIAVVGEVLDATVITRQRRKELGAQFDWLEDVLDGEEHPPS